MNEQPVIFRLIVAAKKRWYHSQEHHYRYQNSSNDDHREQIGHAIDVERFGYRHKIYIPYIDYHLHLV